MRGTPEMKNRTNPLRRYRSTSCRAAQHSARAPRLCLLLSLQSSPRFISPILPVRRKKSRDQSSLRFLVFLVFLDFLLGVQSDSQIVVPVLVHRYCHQPDTSKLCTHSVQRPASGNSTYEEFISAGWEHAELTLISVITALLVYSNRTPRKKGLLPVLTIGAGASSRKSILYKDTETCHV